MHSFYSWVIFHLSSLFIHNFFIHSSVDGHLGCFHVLLLLLSCLSRALCDPIDCSPPGSPVPGILQAGTLEWVAISFSNARKWKVKVKSFSRVWLFETTWTAAYQAPLSMVFSRQECWSEFPLLSPAIVNSAAMNIGVCVFFWIIAISGYIGKKSLSIQLIRYL